MKRPMFANWIRFKKINADEYLVKDLLLENEFYIDAYSVWFAKQLDGKRNPYNIDKSLSKEAVEIILDELEAQNIIRERYFFGKGFLYLLVTIWKPHVTPKLRLCSYLLNLLLMISWLPLLVFSIYCFIFNLNDLSTEHILTGSLFGMFTGLIMHELGHMFACLGYGGRVFEAGLMLQFMLPGAYVLLDSSRIKKRMRRIQISAAGIEMNFLLAAIFLLAASVNEILSGFFMGASIQNIFLAFLNITFVKGFDGMSIMGELLGIEDFVDKAGKVTRSKMRKNKLQKEGVSGKAIITACYILKIVQLALPLIFAVNIAGVITWFL